MKKEYDFSKGVRGKFPRAMKINYPIYLDEDNLKYFSRLAKKKKLDLNTVINDLLRSDKEIIKIG